MSLRYNTILPTLAIALSLSAFTSCGEEEFEGNVYGNALMTVNQDGKDSRITEVHRGDKVNLCIGPTAEKSMQINIVSISSIVYYPEVHYLIDGQEVGKTTDYKTAFSLPYEVKDLEVGKHTLSVDIPQIYKNIFYNIDVLSTNFTVLDEEVAE